MVPTVMLVRALDYKKIELEATSEKSFSDEAEIADYAKESVNALASNGFLKGDGTNFMPQKNITRGELAAIIGRLTAITK